MRQENTFNPKACKVRKNSYRKFFCVSFVFAVLFTFIFTPTIFAESSGMAILDMPTSALSASTMSVFSSEPGNAMNLFENPVGICCDATNINFTNNFWFADVNQSVLTFGKNPNGGAFGAGVNFVTSPGIEVRSRPTDEPEGEIEAQYLVAALGYSREVVSRIVIGANVKYLYESLYTENASGFGLDLSAMWRMPSNMNLTIGLHNLGSMSKLKEESTSLPTTMSFGLVRPRLLDEEGSFNGALGIYFHQNLIAEETEIKVGGEVSIYEKLFLRGGYSIQQEFNDMSFGVGFNVKRFQLDFAMILMDEIPDYPYVFSFSYDL